MATTQAAASRSIRTEERGEAQSRAIYYWAAIGIFFVGLQLYVFWQWYASGDMHRIYPGVTPVPAWMSIGYRINEIFWAITIPLTLYYLVIRPWRQNGRPSFDGLLALAFIFVWWQDALFSYVTMGYSYNTVSFNLGGWSCHIPGWISPGGCQIAQPLAWDFSFYFVLSVLGVIVASNVMRKIKARRPQIRTETLFLGLLVVFAIFDFIYEFFFVWAGLYQYGGVSDVWALFPDKTYKFPMYEPFMVGFLFCFLTSIRYFRNDKGETLAERGLDQVRMGAGAKSWLRFFALAGIVNVMFFLGFSLPVQFFQIHVGTWPKAIQERSYWTSGICGEGTGYACGGSNVAIPQRGKSIHVGPDGELVIPPGTEIPKSVPLKTEE